MGTDRLGGIKLWLAGRSGTYYYYAHLSKFADDVHEGDIVPAGTILGYCGNAGNAAAASPTCISRCTRTGGPRSIRISSSPPPTGARVGEVAVGLGQRTPIASRCAEIGMKPGSDSTVRAAHSAASPPLHVVRLLATVAPQPRWSFDPDDLDVVETRGDHLDGEVLRRMEERCGEPTGMVVGIAVPTVREVTSDDRSEPRVPDLPLGEPAEHRGQGARSPPPRPPRLSAPPAPLRATPRPGRSHRRGDTAGRARAQHRMRRPRAAAASRRGELDMPADHRRRLRRVQRHRIEQRDRPATRCHPPRVPSRATAHIEHPRRAAPATTAQELLGSHALERPSVEARVLSRRRRSPRAPRDPSPHGKGTPHAGVIHFDTTDRAPWRGAPPDPRLSRRRPRCRLRRLRVRL